MKIMRREDQTIMDKEVIQSLMKKGLTLEQAIKHIREKKQETEQNLKKAILMDKYR